MKLSDLRVQQNEAMRLMIRDIALYTNQTEDGVIDEYYAAANPSIFQQVVLGKDKYPITEMLGKMLKSNLLDGKITYEMLLEKKEEPMI